MPAEQRVEEANHILESISTLDGAKQWIDLIADGPRQLIAVADRIAGCLLRATCHTALRYCPDHQLPGGP